MLICKIAISTLDNDKSKFISIGTGEDETVESEAVQAEKYAIERVELSYHTNEENVRDKSKSMSIKVDIFGRIPEVYQVEFLEKLRRIGEWARDFDPRTSCRNLCIGMKINQKFQSVYIIKNVFVSDYKELYTIVGEKGEENNGFYLSLIQKDIGLSKVITDKGWPSDFV